MVCLSRERAVVLLNRILVLCIGCLAFGSWNDWYKAATAYGMLEDLGHVIQFSIFVVVLMAILLVWYLPKRKRVQDVAGEVLRGEATHKTSSREILAGLLEKGFVNLSDAMGYVLAEAWLTQLNPDPSKPLLVAAMIALTCSAIIFALELVAYKFSPDSKRRNGFDLIAHILVGACAWFLSDPLVTAAQRVSGIQQDSSEHTLLLFFLSMLMSLLFMGFINTLQRFSCRAIDLEDDVEVNEEVETSGGDGKKIDEPIQVNALFFENTALMLKTAFFFTSARFLKVYMLSYTDIKPLTLFVGFTIFAAIVAIPMEQAVLGMMPAPPTTIGILLVAYAHANELVSLTLRSMAWVDTKLWVAWTATLIKRDLTWVRIVLAIVNQLAALLLEQFRLRLIVSHVSDSDDAESASNSELSEDDHA